MCLFVCVCMCAGVHMDMVQCTYEGQITTYWSRFSLTMWTLGIETQVIRLGGKSLPTEPSYRPENYT